MKTLFIAFVCLIGSTALADSPEDAPFEGRCYLPSTACEGKFTTTTYYGCQQKIGDSRGNGSYWTGHECITMGIGD